MVHSIYFMFWAHSNQPLKRHLDRYDRFAELTDVPNAQKTHRPRNVRRLVWITRICAMHAMRSSNTEHSQSPWLNNASPYRFIGRYRRSKHEKSIISLKLEVDKPLRQVTLTPTITLKLNSSFHHFWQKSNAPLAIGNKHAATDVPCYRMSAISYILNADSGRYADTPVHELITLISVMQNWPVKSNSR